MSYAGERWTLGPVAAEWHSAESAGVQTASLHLQVGGANTWGATIPATRESTASWQMIQYSGPRMTDCIFHRDDRPLVLEKPSGLMHIALDADAQRELSRQFEARTVRKAYQCVVREGRYKLITGQPKTPRELYDLATDPAETTNLAAEKTALVQRLDAAWQG